MNRLDFLERALHGETFANGYVIDRFAADAGRSVVFYAGKVELPEGIIGRAHFGSGGMAVYDAAKPTLARTETGLFEGLNCFVSIRNGERPEIVYDWLRFHVEKQELQAALIVDRSRPGSNDPLAPKLRTLLSKRPINGLIRVMVVASNVPLGHPNLGPEAHPINVKHAPNKSKMTPPDPDPWSAPLRDIQIYEVLRQKYLAAARAVANIDVHDLTIATNRPSVFSILAESNASLLSLNGIDCFPWQIRNETSAGFGDHICKQFDEASKIRRWCVAPTRLSSDALWKLRKVSGVQFSDIPSIPFYRHVALRHGGNKVSQLVPKSSLIEDPVLVEHAMRYWKEKPKRMPRVEKIAPGHTNGRRAIVTTMKDEGPFIMEWLAYHRAIGFDDFLIFSNDCSDGTDELLHLLDEKGLIHHRQNPYRDMPGLKPQHAALRAAEKEAVISEADWITCIDVDEFVNIKVGNGRLTDLFDAVPNANMISMTWRLFGNGDLDTFSDEFIVDQFQHAAPELCRKPHQAWGFKTLFRNLGYFKKLGVHRPKGLQAQLWQDINWVNGSGRPMPREMLRNAWRSTLGTYGYDLVQLNHYAVRSSESFLVKKARGRVNHTDREQGLAYWFRMNNNAEQERSILRRRSLLVKEWQSLMSDTEIAEMHAKCVSAHRQKIRQLHQDAGYSDLYEKLISPRMKNLSRMHNMFGANVFLSGPDSVPDEILEADLPANAYFTVPRGRTQH